MSRFDGRVVQQLREMCLFTREGLAMHAAIDGGGAVVAAIERGAVVPDAETIAALARALGVSEEELVVEVVE